MKDRINGLLDELEGAWRPGTHRRKRQASDIISDLKIEIKKQPITEVKKHG